MEIIRLLSEEEMLAVAGGFIDPTETIYIAPTPPVIEPYYTTPSNNYGSIIVSTTYGSSGSSTPGTPPQNSPSYSYSNSTAPHSF